MVQFEEKQKLRNYKPKHVNVTKNQAILPKKKKSSKIEFTLDVTIISESVLKS